MAKSVVSSVMVLCQTVQLRISHLARKCSLAAWMRSRLYGVAWDLFKWPWGTENDTFPAEWEWARASFSYIFCFTPNAHWDQGRETHWLPSLVSVMRDVIFFLSISVIPLLLSFCFLPNLLLRFALSLYLKKPLIFALYHCSCLEVQDLTVIVSQNVPC